LEPICVPTMFFIFYLNFWVFYECLKIVRRVVVFTPYSVHVGVSPANGNISLALVKYSNEGGPGPRYNMKEIPGSILIMLVVHAYPMPLFSEAGDKETRGVDLPLHQSNLGKAPSRPLQIHTPPHAKMQIETRLGGNRTSASDSRSEAIDWARGGCGDHFGLFRASVRGQAAELEASAGQPARLSKALL
jgi:hypothetical protein